MADEDEDEVDLGISLTAVAAVVDQARALQGVEEDPADAADEDPEPSDPLLAEEAVDEQTEEMLRAFIAEMNEDEQTALIALAWTGRGDFGPEQWAEAKQLAAERSAGQDTADYLIEMDGVGDLLAEGVAAFGLSIEDVER